MSVDLISKSSRYVTVDRSVQELYHSLRLSGAIGTGVATSELNAEPGDGKPVALVYRTKDRDWVLVASMAAARSSFLKLAEESMAHALDNEGVSTETGILCQTITPDLKDAAERLDVSVFEMEAQKTVALCGFCGGPMNGPGKPGGWNSCQRCNRLFGTRHAVRVCGSCLVAYGAVPEMDEKLGAIVSGANGSWPDMSLCPICRSPDHKALLSMDIIVRAVTDGSVPLQKLKEAGLPQEFLQLINLRSQTRR